MNDKQQASTDAPGTTDAPPAADEALRQAEETYRELAFHTFERDLKFGLNLGFCRTFAVPAIARPLVSTGRMTRHTRARAKATGEMMYGLFEHGLDSERGAAIVAALRRIHAPWPVGNDAYLYVLACFDVAPMRWCAAYAWRAPSQQELAASHTVYRALAARMGLHGVPPSWEEFAAWTDRFEEEHFAPSPEGRVLWGATRSMLSARVPAVFGPLAGKAADSLLDDRLRRAFAVPRPPALLRAATGAALRVRAYRARQAAVAPHRQDRPAGR